MSKQQGNRNGTLTDGSKNKQGYQRLPQDDPLTQPKISIKKKPTPQSNNGKQGPKSFKIGRNNDDDKWTCPTCTFLMSIALHECSMCGDPRP